MNTIKQIKEKGFLCILYLFVCIASIKAQDPHFSQFYASPLTLNPAFTGLIPGDFRVAGTFRNQWASIGSPFTTASAAVDAIALPSYTRGGDILGVGMLALTDRSNNGALKSNYFTLSLAYNKQLDAEGNLRLGGGVQYTIVNKTLDYSKLTFSQQLTPNGYDINLPNGESRPGFNLFYTDYHAGIILAGKDDASDNMWYLGSSLYHIGTPNESVTGQENKLKQRYTVHGMYNHRVKDVDRFYISGLYMNSGIKEEYMVGMVYSYSLDNNVEEDAVGRSIQFGGWYRIKDAVIPYIGLRYDNWSAGLTYDVNTSTLSTASNFRGGFELTLQYNFLETENMRTRRTMKCKSDYGANYLVRRSNSRWYNY